MKNIILIAIIMITLQSCGIEETIPFQTEDEKAQAQKSVKKLYDLLPDVGSCQEGVLKESEKLSALAEVNKIRALHHLKPVIYNYHDDLLVAKSALISVANNHIEHYPPKSAKCYTPEGAEGSSKSNLHIDHQGSYASSVYGVEYGIMRFVVDEDVESIGHRRWILFPFLKEISYGRVDGKPQVTDKYDIVTSVSLKVRNDELADISDTAIEYVAYPYETYPSYYFKHDWFCSFSVLVDKYDRWNNKDVDFSQAKITVTDNEGKQMSVYSVSSNHENYGLSNIIQWKIKDTKNNEKYSVKIKDVFVQGVKKEYNYWFQIK